MSAISPAVEAAPPSDAFAGGAAAGKGAAGEGAAAPVCLFWSATDKEYGAFSQWYMSDFCGDDGQMYCCAEQWMMAEKARLFGDDAVRAAILHSRNPKTMKALGRTVKGFDVAVWNAHCQDIVFRGNVTKFRANALLGKLLEETGTAHIAEASPKDAIWGIGMAASHSNARNPAKWRGKNLLGIALMRVRKALREGDGGGGERKRKRKHAQDA